MTSKQFWIHSESLNAMNESEWKWDSRKILEPVSEVIVECESVEM